MLADLRLLVSERVSEPVKVNVIEFRRGKKLKIKLAALTREDCKKDPRLYKYFRNGNTDLDRFHIPEISKEQYEEIAKTFKQTARFDPKNLNFDTATDYYIRKARVQAVADELGISSSLIDLTDYTWDEAWYTCYDLMRNADEVDDAWRENGEDERELTSYHCYIAMDPKQASVPMEMFNSLYNFCYTAIVKRKVMLYCKVDKCLGFLHSIIEYTNGLSTNCTSAQVATLRSYTQFFLDINQNKDASDWISNTNDIEVFAKNPDTHSDYVETYRKMLMSILRNADISYFREVLSQVEDPYIEEILDPEAFEELEIASEAFLKDVGEAGEELALA